MALAVRIHQRQGVTPEAKLAPVLQIRAGKAFL